MATPHTSWSCNPRIGYSARRYLAGIHVENYIPKAAAIVLVTKRNQSFKVLLQVEGVIVDGFVLCVCVVFAVKTLHFLSGAIIAIPVEVGRDKRDPCFCE